MKDKAPCPQTELETVAKVNEYARLIAELVTIEREDFLPFIVFYARQIVDAWEPMRIDPTVNPYPSEPVKERKYTDLARYIQGRREFCRLEGEEPPTIKSMVNDWLEYRALPDERKRVEVQEPRDLRKEIAREIARLRKESGV